MTQKYDRQMQEDARRIWAGVETVAFTTLDANAHYSAIGVYRAQGKLTACFARSSFSLRVPTTARELYLQHGYCQENEAQDILDMYTGLDPQMQQALEAAAREA